MKLAFDADQHAYKLDGQEVPSVTQIIGALSRGKYEPTPILEQARIRGIRVHELCELSDIGAELDIDPECLPFVLAYDRFKRDYSPEWDYIEKKLGSKNGFAGTVDRVGRIDGYLCVVDLKTTQNMDRISKIAMSVQLAGYSLLCAENGLGYADKLLGVQLRNDGTYTVHNVTKLEKQYDFSASILFMELLRLERFRGGYE